MSAAPTGLGESHHSYLGMGKQAHGEEAAEPACTRPDPRTRRPPGRLPKPFLSAATPTPTPGKPGWAPGCVRSSCDVTAAPVAPGSGATRAMALRGPWILHHCVLCMELSSGPCLEARLPQAPPCTLSVASPENTARLWGPGSSLTLCPPSPPQYLPRKSTPKCRWKTLMLTVAPSSRRRTHPLPCSCPRLLPNLTPLRSQDRPQGASGRLLCFSWMFCSTVSSMHFVEEDTGQRGEETGPRSRSEMLSALGPGAHPFPGLLIPGFRLWKEVPEEALSRIPLIVWFEGGNRCDRANIIVKNDSGNTKEL